MGPALFKHLLAILLLVAACGCSNNTSTPKSTQAVVDSPAARVDWKSMAEFWERSLALEGVDTGPANAKKRMVIYFDPNCPACAKQWQALRPYLDQVRIHWIPVAYLDDTSARLAAGILSATDPAAALTANEQGFDFSTNTGGYVPNSEPPDALIEQIKRNTRKAMKAGDMVGTPTLAFELMRGQRYYRMTGLLEGDALRVAISDLGNTLDPWAKRGKGVSGQASPDESASHEP